MDTRRVSIGNTMSESGLRIRVDSELRAEFIEACRALDTTASQVLRSYMREYVSLHKSAKQDDLFGEFSDREQKL